MAQIHIDETESHSGHQTGLMDCLLTVSCQDMKFETIPLNSQCHVEEETGARGVGVWSLLDPAASVPA